MRFHRLSPTSSTVLSLTLMTCLISPLIAQFPDNSPPRRPGAEAPDGPPQTGPGRGSGGPRGFGAMMMRGLPVMQALDTDEDGALSPEEIAAAGKALLTLDEDGSGTLEGSEWHPPFPPRRGFGGPPPGEDASEPLAPEEIDFKDGVANIDDRETFKKLAYQGSEVLIDTHLDGLEFIKFQIEEAGTDRSRLYFINTKTHRAHMMFMRAVGIPMQGRGDRRADLDPEKDAITMRGVLIYRPMAKAPNGEPGVYTFEFEPNDNYPYSLIAFAHDRLAEKMPLLKGRLGYCPLWGAIDRYTKEKALYDAANFPVYFEDDLMGDIAYLPLNVAESYGRLQWMPSDGLPSARDIVLCKQLPNEMPRTAGVISAVRQTPLSHVNLRAIQDKVPNAFILKADTMTSITDLMGKYVYYKVAPDGFEIREASPSEVDDHFAKLRPRETQVPHRDLSVTTIKPLDNLSFADAGSIGVKAANLAELHRLDLGQDVVPEGYAIPFHFYDAFMKHNAFYEAATKLIEDTSLKASREDLEAALKDFRKDIKRGDFPDELMQRLTQVQKAFAEGASIRCRSSTNNEDLPGFSGAGLYDSYTHHEDEGHLSKSIKQVFASMWNLRAFEEREFYRVDHLHAAMGVLLHPSFSDEQANGVAVTDDILYQTQGHYYVNIQVGEDMVTNPEMASTPEEWLLDWRRSEQDQLRQASNRVSDGTSLLSQVHRDELREALGTIHAGFARRYGKSMDDERFAMEIEFKITEDGKLSIKQARPWVY